MGDSRVWDFGEIDGGGVFIAGWGNRRFSGLRLKALIVLGKGSIYRVFFYVNSLDIRSVD